MGKLGRENVLPMRPCIIRLRAVADTGHPLHLSLLGRFHVGHSHVLDKLLYQFHTRHGRTERVRFLEAKAPSPYAYTSY